MIQLRKNWEKRPFRNLYLALFTFSLLHVVKSSSVLVQSHDRKEVELPGDGLEAHVLEQVESASTNEAKIQAQKQFWKSQSNKGAGNEDASNNVTDNIPFVKPYGIHKSKEHFLPEGFQISARVISSPEDGLSYFSSVNPDSPIKIPYQECSSVGITTPPINLNHLNFRHLPPAGTNPVWSNTGPTPQLVICLHPLQITVSGNNEKRIFKAGEVILLEDVMGRGHKMSAVEDSKSEDDLSVLILTLPNPPKHKKQTWNYHHSKATTNGKNGEENSKQQKPCSTEDSLPYFIPSLASIDAIEEKPERPDLGAFIREVGVRRALLTSTGIAASSALTYFLGKVAPPVLAVVFGGGCVVVGGTCMVVKGGEALMYQLDERQRRRSVEEVLSKLDEPEAEIDEVILMTS